MDISKEASKAIEESRILEHHLTEFLVQKQNIQVELQEVLGALDELKKNNDDVYKILSGVMIKSDKEKLSKELEEKKKLLQMRISAIEKQEDMLEKKISETRIKIKEVMEKKK